MAPASGQDPVLHQLAAAAGIGRDLSHGLADLLRLAIQAVPSCLGVSLTTTRHGLPMTVVALTPGRRHEQVRSSLALGLPGAAGSEPGNALTVYAAATSAFRSMAPDLVALLDVDPRRAVIDAHFDLPADSDTGGQLRSQLDETAIIDHALGVLLDRGLLPTQGRLELERVAAEQHSSLAGAAQIVLDEIRPDPDSATHPPDP